MVKRISWSKALRARFGFDMFSFWVWRYLSGVLGRKYDPLNGSNLSSPVSVFVLAAHRDLGIRCWIMTMSGCAFTSRTGASLTDANRGPAPFPIPMSFYFVVRIY